MTSVLASGVGAFVLALVLTQLCKPLARRIDVVARPKADRWHREVIPLLGGVGIAGAVYLVAALLSVHSPQLLALLGGAAALFVVGVIDDIRPFRPQTKFVLQILVSATMVALGLQLRLSGFAPLDFLLTMFWLVGITNAFNLLDNMDGLAAGIAAITTAFRLVFFLNDGDLEAAQVAASVVGACLGFLIHNSNPASIFMGDAGSLLLGFLVAGLSLAGTYPYSRSTVSVLLFPVLLLLVPIFDTTFVTIARTLAGRPVSRGGKDHTSHRLVASGLSERRAVLLLYFVALLCGGVAFHGYTAGLSSTIVFIVFLGMGLLLFGLFLGRVQVYPEGEAAEASNGALLRLVDSFPYKRQISTVAIDSLLIVVAYYSAYRLRFEQNYPQHEPWFTTSAPLVLACQLVAFAAFRVYQGVWRYTGMTDLIRLVKASVVGTAVAIVVLVILYRFEGYSRAVFVIDWLLLLICVGGSRLSFRIFGELLRGEPLGLQRVLIYGAGDAGELVLREIRNTPKLGRVAIGFLDDNRWKHRSLIHGVPVLGGIDHLEKVFEQKAIDEVIVCASRIPADRLEVLAEVCARQGVRLVRTWRDLDDLIAS